MLENTFRRTLPAFREHDVWVDFTKVSLDGVTVIPFTCDYLLECVKDYAAKGTTLDILVDFLHGVGFGNFKVGAVGVAAFHWDENHYSWNNTDIPGCFVIANREHAPAAKALLQSFFSKMLEHHGVNVRVKAKRAITDDGAAIKAALDETM